MIKTEVVASLDSNINTEIFSTETLISQSVQRLSKKRSHMLLLMRNLVACKSIIKRNAKASQKDLKALNKSVLCQQNINVAES